MSTRSAKLTTKESVCLVAAVLCVAVSAAWAYTAPDGTTHTNSSTCNATSCLTQCQNCCRHFHPFTSPAPGFMTCIASCKGMGSNCTVVP